MTWRSVVLFCALTVEQTKRWGLKGDPVFIKVGVLVGVVAVEGDATVGHFSLDAVYIVMNTASKTLMCQLLSGLGAGDTAM